MPQKIHCKVVDLIDHGEHVYSVFLKPDSLAPRFSAGQFLHLALDSYSLGDFWPDSRVFSIASAPAERSLLRITYAVKGQFTTRMESELRPGREVWIKMPYGDFIINPESDVCLLAGGTGITAFTAFIGGLPAEYRHQIHLFYGARRPDLLIYRLLVETALQCCPNLHSTFLAEESAEGTDCISGRIDLNLVWKSIPDPLAVTYYIAGPPEMIRIFTQGLSQRGVPTNCIIIDAWE
ncbi:MAG: FAD-dependent oxidoreductase [Chloroflexi bacterium]|nr:FAD-dependent oxidoreductase [Chloroflexota bacterium]